MNYFQQWASGLLDYEEVQQMVHEREAHVTRILPVDQLKERWDQIGYKPPAHEYKQLELF